jgi:hypothetical protein
MGRRAKYFFNDSGARASLFISRRYMPNFGTAAVNNEGGYDAAFLCDMLTQTRSANLSDEYEEIPSTVTNVRLYRVYAEQTAVGLHIKR